MKVIFLDIDGVLNSSKWFIKNSANINKIDQTEFECVVEHIDPDTVSRLNRVVEATGSVFVISSTWRLAHSLIGLRKIFDHVGIKGEIIGKTKNLSGQHHYPRGYEIEAWIEANGITHYAVLEDDVVEMEMLGDHIVQTTFEHGLLDEHVEQAIKILNHK